MTLRPAILPMKRPNAPPNERVARLGEAIAIRAAGIGEDGFEPAESRPAGNAEAGEIADHQGNAKRESGAQAAKPVHLAGDGEDSAAESG
jgi:hypothetical protein